MPMSRGNSVRAVLLVCWVWLVAMGTAGSATSGRTAWRITDLGTLGGKSPASWAIAINERGEVIGESRGREVHEGEEISPIRGFVWRAGALSQLPPLAGITSYPAAINDRGQIVGSSYKSPDETGHAVLI